MKQWQEATKITTIHAVKVLVDIPGTYLTSISNLLNLSPLYYQVNHSRNRVMCPAIQIPSAVFPSVSIRGTRKSHPILIRSRIPIRIPLTIHSTKTMTHIIISFKTITEVTDTSCEISYYSAVDVPKDAKFKKTIAVSRDELNHPMTVKHSIPHICM